MTKKTAQTHTVATDALATLGTLIDATAGRDAIHLAVEPVVAGERLFPGQHIRMENGLAVSNGKTYGIVDPFLPGVVYPGQRFWFIIYPRQITSLRHVWEHPMFPNVVEAEEASGDKEWDTASEWMTKFAEQYDMSRDDMLSSASNYLVRGDYLIGGDRFEGERVPDEFWDYYEILMKEVVPDRDRGSFFSCSC